MIKYIKAHNLTLNSRILTLSGLVTINKITSKNGLICVNETIKYDSSETVLIRLSLNLPSFAHHSQ